ncbi:MAG TPA: OmpA family protein [Devosiaceae bacterium]|nr:OmpA family protein [Devosiaceae bacterium]
MIEFRHWPAMALSLLFLLSAPTFTLAQDAPADNGQGRAARHAQGNGGQGGGAQLPQACVDAGATNPADCRAVLGRGKGQPGRNQSQEKPPAQPAQLAQPAAQPPAEQPAQRGRRAQGQAPDQQQPAPGEGQTRGGPGNQFVMRNPAQSSQEATPAENPPANAPAARRNAPSAQEGDQTRRPRLPRECVAAGITTQAECDALRAGSSKPKVVQSEQPAPKPAEPTKPVAGEGNGKPATAPQKGRGQPTAGADQQGQAPEGRSAAPQAGAQQPAQPGNEPPAAAAGQPGAAPETAAPGRRQQTGRLDRECVAAGIKTPAQCDAFHAINTQQGKANQPAAGAGQPGQAQGGAPAPAASTAQQPVENIPNLPKGVSRDEVAPLFDSAKDQQAGKGSAAQRGERQGQGRPARNLPPPQDDKAAQSDLGQVKVNPIDQAKGQEITAGAAAPQIQLPPNVTIINNNGQNNAGPGMQNGGRQQDRSRPGEFGPGGMAGNGPDHGRPGGPRDNQNPIGLGLGTIVQLGNQMIIHSPAQDQRRIGGRPDDRTNYERLPGGNYRETILRPDGVRVVTIYNRNGDILRRSRFDRNNREVVLAYFDSQHDQDLLDWRDPGDELPPLQLDIPPEDYVLDADNADEQQLQQFFARPPVEHVQRLYSIDEVKRSARIRDMVPRLEIGDLTFDTGAATIAQDQVGNLANVADAMEALLEKNPAETFLIEGHTDAVGSAISNLSLSDERAATVAQVLTDFYHIPPENLATQGYGESFLKIQTDGSERINRRVTIRRITPLVTIANQSY